MSEMGMVERVARAIAKSACGDDEALDDRGTPAWRACLNEAKVAIKAMREPTEAMILAACAKAKEEQVRPIEINRIDADTLYRAMIDAALG
jgi:hypothetical protein